jgi:hypothetical protein
LTIRSKILILNLLNISIFMPALTPLNLLINTALSGDIKYDLFTLGLGYNTLASPAEATPLKAGQTPTAPPVQPAFPAGAGVRGFFDAYRFTRSGGSTDWTIQLPYSVKVLSRSRSLRAALVPLVAPAILPVLKAAATPVALITPVDSLEQAIYDLAIANGATFSPKIDPATGRDWLEASGTTDLSIELLLAGYSGGIQG